MSNPITSNFISTVQTYTTKYNIVRRMHHILCSNYGWIPYNEFMELPIPIALGLIIEINEDNNKVNNKLK